MDTAIHPNSAPEAALNVELLESSVELIARCATEFGEAVSTERCD